MLNPEDKEKIQNLIRMHWFIFLSFASAILMYTLVVFLVTGNRSVEPHQIGAMKSLFIVISIVFAAAKFWIQSRLLYEETAYGKCGTLDEIIGKYVSRYFITLALCEAPALFGLVITFLTMRIEEWWLFFIISAVLFGTSAPRSDKLESIADAQSTRVL